MNMCVFSMQDCLKQQGEQSSDSTTTAVRPKEHQDQEPCALGKLTDHLEAMPEFTIENVVYLFIYIIIMYVYVLVYCMLVCYHMYIHYIFFFAHK